MSDANAWSGRKVLVTGAGGFIGSHLTEALVRAGAEVRAFARYNSRADAGMLGLLPDDVQSRFEIHFGDITDPWSVAHAVEGVDVVFHLAALIAIPYSYVAPASYVETNVRGTLNVLEAGKRAGVSRIVHTSTSETYGTAIYTPIDEKHPLQGQSPYSASKTGADQLAESYFRSFELPVAIIRPFNTYGPRQSARAVIPTIASQALAGRPRIQLGRLDPVRDMCFVRDTVAGFMAIAGADACLGKITNVGTGRGLTIGEIANVILEVCDRKDMEITADAARLRPDASEVFELICDASMARERCGWTAKVAIEEGLREVVEFIRTHPELYRPEQYTL